MKQFNEIVTNIMSSTDEATAASYWQPRITQIVETYLGKGMKASQCTRDQVEALDLIVTDLRSLM